MLKPFSWTESESDSNIVLERKTNFFKLTKQQLLLKTNLSHLLSHAHVTSVSLFLIEKGGEIVGSLFCSSIVQVSNKW